MYAGYPVLAAPGGIDVREHRDGTLLIDLIDSSIRHLVWRGTATDTFEPGAEVKTVSNAIEKTLDQHPPALTN